MRNSMLTQCLRDWSFFPGRSVTLAVIVTDHLTMPAFFSVSSLFLHCHVLYLHSLLDVTHIPSLTPDLKLPATWISSDSTGPREGGLRLRCLRYGGSCMAACIPGISWAPSHSFPSTSHARPSHCNLWLLQIKWKADVVTLLFNIIYWVPLQVNKSQNANIDPPHALKSHLLWLPPSFTFPATLIFLSRGSLDLLFHLPEALITAINKYFVDGFRHCSSLCELNTWKAPPYWSIHSLPQDFLMAVSNLLWFS